MRVTLALAAIVLVAACHPATPVSVPDGQVQIGDLVGNWNVGFRLSPGSRSDSLLPAPEVVGTLRVRSQPDSQYSDYLTATLTVDFHPMLGRQVTCLARPQPALVQPRDSGSVYLWLTPGAADCGLFATGQFAAGAITGTWVEPSFTSEPLALGSFRMWR